MSLSRGVRALVHSCSTGPFDRGRAAIFSISVRPLIDMYGCFGIVGHSLKCERCPTDFPSPSAFRDGRSPD